MNFLLNGSYIGPVPNQYTHYYNKYNVRDHQKWLLLCGFSRLWWRKVCRDRPHTAARRRKCINLRAQVKLSPSEIVSKCQVKLFILFVASNAMQRNSIVKAWKGHQCLASSHTWWRTINVQFRILDKCKFYFVKL